MTPDQQQTIESFARLLANEENDAKRAQLIQRARMLAMNDAAESAFEPPVTSLGDYLAQPIPIPPSLVWPTLVVRGEITAVLGRAGKGKTTLNLNRLLRWAAGKPWFDDFHNDKREVYLRPDNPLRVLIIENEGSAGMFHYKMGLMLARAENILTDEDRDLIRSNIHVWGDGGYSGLKLDDPTMLGHVRAGVEKVKPDILFIEPFRGLWRGEENSSTDMAVVIDNILGIASDYDCGVILSHHERKSGVGEDGELMSAGRGSTVLEGAAAVMENFQSAKGGDFRELTWSKARYLPPPETSLRVQYDRDTGWYHHVPLDLIERSIVETIRGNDGTPMSVRDLADELEEKPEKVRVMCNRMVAEGELKSMPSTSDGHGSTGKRYRLPADDDHDGLAI